MHGRHSFSGASKLWWSPVKPPSRPARQRALAGAVPSKDRAHSIFQSSDANHRFRAGGLICDEGVIADQEPLHRLMKLLALRIDEASRAPEGIPENEEIPSGYTYLLQLIAHDMVDSVISAKHEDETLRPAARNARGKALMLDTLYGAGPDESPAAYAISEAGIRGRGDIPRLQLRVGALQAPSAEARTLYCPYRDLARAKAPPADGLGGSSANLLTEAYIADPRNDAHAFMSQITVLFSLLHNHVLGLLAVVPPSQSSIEDAYRQFLCARTIVTMIYRNIILKDLLPRIILKAVLDRYRSDNDVFLDGEKDVPIEFTHGAFRFGHAMVRVQYRVRDEIEHNTTLALAFSAARLPTRLPVPELWFVDWARFFKTAKPADPNFHRNYSLRIGPHFSSALRDSTAFPAKSPSDTEGLANRDLLSAAYAGLLSVPALSAKMQSIFGEGVVRPYADWKDPLRKWLTNSGSTGVEWTKDDLDRLVDDPPLPFFVLFEAERATQGLTLGPIGSIIVAETIYGALRRDPHGFENAGPTLQKCIAACAAAHFPDRAPQAREAVASIAEIACMPALLEQLARAQLLPNLMPA
jgi:Animal haem peroxidase